MRGRPQRYGEINPLEKGIIEEIVFRREIKRQSFQIITNDLNAEGLWPRKALKWSWGLVRNVYITNKKSMVTYNG
jgi:hypothetical protein